MDLVNLVGDTFWLPNEKAHCHQHVVLLRFFACRCFQLMVGDLFGISKATVCKIAEATTAAFRATANFPNVIGCVDCIG